MTNAATRKPTSEGGVMSSKEIDGHASSGVTKGKIALRDSNGTAAYARGKATTANGGKVAVATSRIAKPSSQRADDSKQQQERQTRATRRVASAIPLRSKTASTTSTFSRSNSVQSDASRRTASSAKEENVVTKRARTEAGERKVATTSKDANQVNLKHKKTTSNAAMTEAVKEVVPVRAKDEGWEDLEADEADDILMVTEYVNEIFDYMKMIEVEYIPSGDYIDKHPELTWQSRGVLVDWLIDIHSKFRLVPETLFLAQNIVDRFLSLRTISLNKLQLVGLTAMFIAAKYEEVLCPSVHNFLYLAEGAYTDEEILKAERYMLRIIKFNLSYASPMNFLRRISKADNYDIQTRTVAKFFMEISLVDHRLLEHPPSVIAAAAIWSARLVLERGEWGPTLVHYSSYSVEELLPTAELMVDYCCRPIHHPQFVKKYSAKKFMKAATYVFDWTKRTFGDFSMADDVESSNLPSSSDELCVDLFGFCSLERPISRRGTSDEASTASRSNSPGAEQGEDVFSDEEQRSGRGMEDDLPIEEEEGEEEIDEDELDRRETSQDARLLTDMTNVDAVMATRKTRY